MHLNVDPGSAILQSVFHWSRLRWPIEMSERVRTLQGKILEPFVGSCQRISSSETSVRNVQITDRSRQAGLTIKLLACNLRRIKP